MDKISCRGQVIVQGNRLVEGAYASGIDEMRLLHYALAEVNPTSSFSQKPFILRADKFAESFDIPKSDAYRRLKKAVDKLLITPICTYDPQPDGSIDEVKYPWFSILRYKGNRSGEIEVSFNNHIAIYLYEIKTSFSKIKLEHICKLETPLAYRLYSWLNQVRLLDSNKRNGGVFRELDLMWIKERAGYGKDAYPDYKDFKRRVIDVAVNQINSSTDISLIYKPIRTGKKITSIEFFFVENKGVEAEPVRPRLPKRPETKKGLDAEGQWARKCAKILEVYRVQLRSYSERQFHGNDKDKVVKIKDLTLADFRRLSSYYKITGDLMKKEKIDKIIDERQYKAGKSQK